MLAKFYLRAVDLSLSAEGLRHKRWVDDFRIFCDTEAEARRALVVLAEALGRRGLVLQSGKSRVLPANAARAKFAVVQSLLGPVQTQVAAQLQAVDGHEPSYLPPWEVDAALAQAGAVGAVEVLNQAFAQYFLTDTDNFNKSLLHYLLRRLAAAQSRTHLQAIVGLLRTHPEEFDHIAQYVSDVRASEQLEERFLADWSAGVLPYPYLAYQFLRWRVREVLPMSTGLRTFVRTESFVSGRPTYVRAIARAVLGKFGDAADLERLEASYADAQSALERAEILCSLQRMESGRRNALYGRAAADGDLASSAVRLARENAVAWEAC